MIQALRVDHRLLHGQVAFSWSRAIGADCILLASDTLLTDNLRLQTVKLAKPDGMKVVAKGIEQSIKAIESGVTDKYHLFIICETIDDAAVLARRLNIKKINLGGTRPAPDKKEIGTAVFVNEHDVKVLKELQAEGITSFIQGVPSSKPVECKDIL